MVTTWTVFPYNNHHHFDITNNLDLRAWVAISHHWIFFGRWLWLELMKTWWKTYNRFTVCRRLNYGELFFKCWLILFELNQRYNLFPLQKKLDGILVAQLSSMWISFWNLFNGSITVGIICLCKLKDKFWLYSPRSEEGWNVTSKS